MGVYSVDVGHSSCAASPFFARTARGHEINIDVPGVSRSKDDRSVAWIQGWSVLDGQGIAGKAQKSFTL